jgi:outer membrane protein TolC
VTGFWGLLVLAAVPTNTGPLTEGQAVEQALQNSPQVRYRGHSVEEAEAQTEAGLAWNNPLFRIGGLRYHQLVDPMIDGRSYGNHPLDHASVALRWSPPALGERGARRAQGQANEADARMELTIAQRDITALVRKLHAEIVNYDAQLALGKDVVGQRAKLRDLVKSRLEQHAATLLDESLSEIDYLDAKTQNAGIEVRRRAAYDELLLQLGLPQGTSITLASSGKDTCPAPEDAATLAERARVANPRLRLLQAEQNAVDAERTRRWLDLVPWVDYLQVGYGFAGDDSPSYVAFQLQFTLPIFDWKRPHRRALNAREAALSERIQADNRALSDQVLRTTAALGEKAALVARYHEAASVVDGGLTHLRHAVERGAVTNLFEVVQLQGRLLATQRSYLQAQLECKLQQIELDRLTGTGLGKTD